MISGKVKLILDMGNSETRGRVKFGVDSDGMMREGKFTLSNVFSKVEDANYVVPADYTTADSTMFTIPAVQIGNGEVAGTYVNGNICATEFSSTPIRPTALDKKYNLQTTPLTFALAILKATEIVADMAKVSNLNELDLIWDVSILLPPAEKDKGLAEMTRIVKSINHIDYKFPEVSLDIRVDNVVVYPEGFCAFIGAVFTRGMKIRQGMEKWLQDTVLVQDIGAGTTDRMIIKGGRVISDSLDSSQIGGNQVTQAVKRRLRKDLDLPLPDEEILQGVITGVVRDGSKLVDISKIVIQAKKDVATQEVNELTDYFEDLNYPMRTISGILACGGGTLESENPSIPPLSDVMLGFLETLMPNSELLELPKDKNGVPISPRELNIEGASILCEANNK